MSCLGLWCLLCLLVFPSFFFVHTKNFQFANKQTPFWRETDRKDCWTPFENQLILSFWCGDFFGRKLNVRRVEEEAPAGTTLSVTKRTETKNCKTCELPFSVDKDSHFWLKTLMDQNWQQQNNSGWKCMPTAAVNHVCWVRRVVQINIIIAKWEKYEMVKLKNIN